MATVGKWLTDDRAIDEGRELLRAVSEVVAHWGKRQHHVQILPDELNKELPAILAIGNKSLCLDLVRHVIHLVGNIMDGAGRRIMLAFGTVALALLRAHRQISNFQLVDEGRPSCERGKYAKAYTGRSARRTVIMYASPGHKGMYPLKSDSRWCPPHPRQTSQGCCPRPASR